MYLIFTQNLYVSQDSPFKFSTRPNAGEFYEQNVVYAKKLEDVTFFEYFNVLKF